MATDDARTTHGPLETLILEPTLWKHPEQMTLVDRMAMHGVPGVSVAVIEDGWVAWTRAYGVHEIGATDEVTTETRFQAGSISKAITATAVLRLVEEGHLSLDEDVNVCLRSWQVPANGDWQPRVTLRQLLSRSAGATTHGFLGYEVGEALPSEAQTLSGTPPANTREVRVNLLPGTYFRNSGGGTVIAQLVLVDALGKPFPDLMRDLVLDPLDMAQSTFVQPLSGEDPSRATGHHVGHGTVYGRWRIYPEMAAAGLWTTPSDLGRWIGDLLRATRGEPNTLLSPEAVRMMATPQLEGYVGLGLFLHGSGSATRLGHEGDTVGFQAEVFGYPSTGARFAVMSNSDVAYTLRKDIVRTLAVTYGWEDLSPSGRPPPVVHPDGESELAGTYRLRRSVLRVAYQKDALWLEVPEQKATRLNPRGKGVCVCTGANGSVVLQRRDGMVTGLVLRQDEQNLEADRLPSP